MAGISIYPEVGSIVVGKYGQYLVKNHIDGGGNGVVFAVDVISGGELLPKKSGYVIKFCRHCFIERLPFLCGSYMNKGDVFMNNRILIPVKKLSKYILLSVVCLIAEDIFKSLGILDFFNKDINFWTVDICLLLLGMVIIIVGMFVFKQKDFHQFNFWVKRYCQHLTTISFIGEMLFLYKCQSIYQTGICMTEFVILYYLIDYELGKLYGYGFKETEHSYSNYVEKPVIGRNNLTTKQTDALDQLIKLIDKRKSTDGFNVALIGEWGSGKTSITDTLIYELENRKNSNKYFVLKISVLSLKETKNIVVYVKNYFEELFRKYEIGIGRRNIAFLTSLAKCFESSMPWGDVLSGNSDNFFFDIENEKELLKRQVQRLLKVSGRKNILFIIDDTDRSEDENQIIRLLTEFASIDGIVSVISLDKERDIILRPHFTEEASSSVYNPIDKYIHVRIRIQENTHVEYEKSISEQIVQAFNSIVPKENSYILYSDQNKRVSLFESVKDYQTTVIFNSHNRMNNSHNILTELFFDNLKKQSRPFGEYFEGLMNEFIYNSKELFPYIQKMLAVPAANWGTELTILNFQWIHSLGMDEFDWLMRLQSNTNTIFWMLCQTIEAIDLLNKCPNKIKDEIHNVEDIYDYWMILKFPLEGRNWENRKEQPVIYSGFDQIKLIVFQNGEWEQVNERIKEKSFSEVRNIMITKTKGVANLFLVSMLLMDFMEYLRTIMNNYRTFKMQLRETEMLNLNYLDYLIKEWQPRQQIRDAYEKMQKDNPIIKELNIAMPSLQAFINNLLFENYILKFGNRFREAELKDCRLFVYHGKERNIVVISKKNAPIRNAIFLEVSGNVISNISDREFEEIEKKHNTIWSN